MGEIFRAGKNKVLGENDATHTTEERHSAGEYCLETIAGTTHLLMFSYLCFIFCLVLSFIFVTVAVFMFKLKLIKYVSVYLYQ